MAITLLCNAVLSVLATAAQLYVSYGRQEAALRAIPKEVEVGFGGSLSDALWAFNFNQVELLLKGILSQASVEAVTLTTPEGRSWSFETGSAAQVDPAEISLKRLGTNGGPRELGVLTLGLSTDRIWSNIYAQVFTVFLSNLAKTALASLVILLAFRHLISRHLRAIATYVSAIDWMGRAPPLDLHRGQAGAEDDIEAIETAINQARETITNAVEQRDNTERQLRAVLDASSSGVIGLRANGDVAIINPAARKIVDEAETPVPFAWPGEIRFLDHVDLHPHDTLDDPIQRSLSGETLRGEISMMTRGISGGRRYVRVSSAPVEDAGHLIRTVIILDDVSEQETNRQQIERSSRLDALGQLTGGIAHDFNNLLATMIYALDLAKTAQDRAQTERYLDLATKAATRGADLTGRLLSFAKQQPGLAESKPVAATLGELRSLVEPTIEEVITLDFDLPDDGVEVHCDHSQLMNAVLNLIINARDAVMRSGEGDRIIVSARAVSSAENSDAGLWDESEMVEVAVIDNGAGMTDEVRRRATDPFFTTKDVQKGTGLGLSMAYGFAQQSNGELKIENLATGGLAVRLLLPSRTARRVPAGEVVSDETKPAVAQTATDVAGEGVSALRKILIVEDEPTLLDAMKSVLQAHGFDVLGAASGNDALALIERGNHFDLLLTDVGLPDGMGGFELVERVRKIWPDIPVIYMSGYMGFAEVATGAVVAPMLPKPCPPEELVTAVKKAMAAQNYIRPH
ncbi:MAG: response regulator [Paracoccaceae bacterium]